LGFGFWQTRRRERRFAQAVLNEETMGLAIGVGMLTRFAQEEPEKAEQMRLDLEQINAASTTGAARPRGA
jgi:hypothetical protein